MNSPHHDTARALIEGSPAPGGDDFQNTAVRGSSRRTLLKGAAWSVPVIAMAADAPAYAASNEAQLGAVFDGGSGANGYLNSTYLNIGLARDGNLTSYTLVTDITVYVSVVGLLGATRDERSFGASTSNGTLTRGTYNADTRTTPFVWVIPAGTALVKASDASSLPDIFFRFQDGLTGAGRLTNKIVITGILNGRLSDPSTPPVDSSVVKDYKSGNASPDGIY
ncbi:hypothetical protein [Kocuria sp.]|uniref:hypothetical protein n=1 Tax=Kocuria sp. TaxID=1871328 RepID=UPI0026DB64CE|nr:hypothetical protein [Kocuria sp.]MDO4917944.1 hypothetical protein [Kocuria sp.]